MPNYGIICPGPQKTFLMCFKHFCYEHKMLHQTSSSYCNISYIIEKSNNAFRLQLHVYLEFETLRIGCSSLLLYVSTLESLICD